MIFLWLKFFKCKESNSYHSCLDLVVYLLNIRLSYTSLNFRIRKLSRQFKHYCKVLFASKILSATSLCCILLFCCHYLVYWCLFVLALFVLALYCVQVFNKDQYCTVNVITFNCAGFIDHVGFSYNSICTRKSMETGEYFVQKVIRIAYT